MAWKVLREGHEVRVYVKAKDDADVYDGILEKVSSWEEHKDWADVIVFDDVGFGDAAAKLRKAGKLVVGGTPHTDMLEMDREFGQQEMRRLGMQVLPHWDFESFDTCIEFLKANPGRYVWKPSGNTPSNMKGILFLGTEDDGRDIIEVLERNKTAWAKKIKGFQVQKFVAGVEIAVGAFFNGTDFIYPINVNLEHKKLFPGDIGPYTGEMGTLMYWSSPNTIFNLTLAKMKDDLQKSGYVGYVDINCIANGRGVYPLEFTCRFGYPTIQIQMEGIQTPMGEFLYKLANHESFEIKTKKGFQIGACLAVPPFPYHDKDQAEVYRDLSIIFRKPNSLDGFHLGDVKYVDGDWRVAGNSGYVSVVSGAGTTVAEARAQMYSRINNVNLQNMFYRKDIGLRWEADSDRLQTWGYLYG